MFDVFDQAHGLQAWAPAQATRLLVVPATAHGGVAHQLLWLLARRLAREGEQVLVLDGMAHEAADAGLRALLDAQLKTPSGAPVPWPGEWTEDAVTGVHIMPGRQGLMQLGNQAHGQAGGAAVQRLAQALPPGVFVLLTAPVEVLAVLLQGTAARPLVPLDAQPRSLVEAYNAAKVLLQAGELLPVLVPMAPAGRFANGRGLAALEAPVQALAQCARTHLGVDLQIWPVAYDESRDTPADRVPEPWWFKVLDSALTVTSEVTAGGMSRPAEVAAEPDSRRC
jgi:hypothetical protein